MWCTEDGGLTAVIASNVLGRYAEEVLVQGHSDVPCLGIREGVPRRREIGSWDKLGGGYFQAPIKLSSFTQIN